MGGILVMIRVQVIREGKRNIAVRNSRGPGSNYNECIKLDVCMTVHFIDANMFCSTISFFFPSRVAAFWSAYAKPRAGADMSGH